MRSILEIVAGFILIMTGIAVLMRNESLCKPGFGCLLCWWRRLLGAK